VLPDGGPFRHDQGEAARVYAAGEGSASMVEQ